MYISARRYTMERMPDALGAPRKVVKDGG